MVEVGTLATIRLGPIGTFVQQAKKRGRFGPVRGLIRASPVASAGSGGQQRRGSPSRVIPLSASGKICSLALAALAAQVRPHLTVQVLIRITGSHRYPDFAYCHPNLRADLQ
jgi:hypothetical protein